MALPTEEREREREMETATQSMWTPEVVKLITSFSSTNRLTQILVAERRVNASSFPSGPSLALLRGGQQSCWFFGKNW